MAGWGLSLTCMARGPRPHAGPCGLSLIVYIVVYCSGLAYERPQMALVARYAASSPQNQTQWPTTAEGAGGLESEGCCRSGTVHFTAHAASSDCLEAAAVSTSYQFGCCSLYRANPPGTPSCGAPAGGSETHPVAEGRCHHPSLATECRLLRIGKRARAVSEAVEEPDGEPCWQRDLCHGRVVAHYCTSEPHLEMSEGFRVRA